jgi:hypothetical protein
VLSVLHSKVKRQLKRHPEKRGIDTGILYTGIYGHYQLSPHEGIARKEVRQAVDVALARLIREGAVIRVGKYKVSPAVVNLRRGARVLFNMAAPERSNVASALA